VLNSFDRPVTLCTGGLHPNCSQLQSELQSELQSAERLGPAPWHAPHGRL